MVTQDAHLFHETIRSNLLYACPTASEREMREALSDAQLRELVDSLPEGLDTMVGEHGYRLSGGEKQRLAIATVLLKSPDLLILDEPTAHLDSNSEKSVQRALIELPTDRTTVVIAHRLSTVMKADQILVVSEGRIVQRGTHRKLLREKSQLYSRLFEAQFFSA